MLGNVETGKLILGRRADSAALLHDTEGDYHHNRRISGNRRKAEQLESRLLEGAGVEKTGKACGGVGVCKKSHGDCSPDTVCHMYAHGADGIVDVELKVEQLDHENNQEAGNDTHNGSAYRVICVAARGNADKTCKRGVEAHGNIGFAVSYPCKEHGGHGCNRGSNRGGEEYGGKLGGGGGGGSVEAVPAEPQNEHSESSEGYGVAGNGVDLCYLAALVLNILADTGSEEGSAHKCSDTADHVNGAGACIIVEAELRKPAAAPDPMGLDGIDEKGNNRGINAVGRKLGAFGHGARNDGCGGGAEHKVEYEGGGVGKAFGGTCDEVLEVLEHVHVGNTDESEKGILTHHKGVAQERKNNCADTKVHQVFHYDVAGVFCSCKSGLDHCETGLHPKDEGSTDQVPKFNCHKTYISLNLHYLKFISLRRAAYHMSGRANIPLP